MIISLRFFAHKKRYYFFNGYNGSGYVIQNEITVTADICHRRTSEESTPSGKPLHST